MAFSPLPLLLDAKLIPKVLNQRARRGLVAPLNDLKGKLSLFLDVVAEF